MADGSKRSPVVLGLIAFFALLTLGTVWGFLGHTWRPPLASRHGADVDATINYLLAATGVIFVAGHVVVSFFLWKFSKAGGTPGDTTVSRKTELLVGIVPVILMVAIAEVGVLFIGFPVWAQLYHAPPADALEVDVVGQQFEWLVRYPGKDGKFGKTDPAKIRASRNPMGLVKQDPASHDDIVLRGTLRLPVNRHCVIRLRSHDVLHSFWIPAFRTKQDAIPGYTGRTQFTPTKTGTYEIGCAELCGLGHYNMRANAVVLEPAEFDAWLAKQIGMWE